MDELSDIESLVQHINSARGRSRCDGQVTGWPDCFKYDFDENQKVARLTFCRHDKQAFRRAEPWGLAFVDELQESSDTKISGIDFVIGAEGREPEIEALLRRLSFLALANPEMMFRVIAEQNDGPLVKSLYDKDNLYNRPANEIIKEDFKDRKDNDKPGRLEKDFQAFLFGKGKETAFDDRTNERLAVFGEDFYNLPKNKKFKLVREFPTSVFRNIRSKDSHVLPTEFVDIVTLNKNRHLAVIELKLDNPELHVISQLLNYALFFRCYLDKLKNVLKSRLGREITLPLECYVANNHFHPRFSGILKYYQTDISRDGFLLKQIELGKTAEFGKCNQT